MVAKSISYKIILAITAYYSLVVHQMNVKFAFLNTKLDKKIYIKLSEEFKNLEKNNIICKLLKFLYKLKQTS